MELLQEILQWIIWSGIVGLILLIMRLALKEQGKGIWW